MKNVSTPALGKNHFANLAKLEEIGKRKVCGDIIEEIGINGSVNESLRFCNQHFDPHAWYLV